MKTSVKTGAVGLLAGVLMAGSVFAGSVEEGKKLAYDRKLGNCLACHMAGDGASPGDIGPPLVAMKARFPDREALRAQIYDAETKNPDTIMPPFGRHKILSAEQIEKVIDFLYTL